MSPLARARKGEYKIPTFIVHGTEDEVAPFESAQRLIQVLQANGVRSGLLALEGVSHVHDLRLKPGMELWDTQIAPGYQFLFDTCADDE